MKIPARQRFVEERKHHDVAQITHLERKVPFLLSAAHFIDTYQSTTLTTADICFSDDRPLSLLVFCRLSGRDDFKTKT